jgi:uncharacterized protein (TIGR03086 family)
MTSKANAPDPIALFEKAALQVQEIMAGIRQGQADDATPCTEWNVRQVMNHVIGGAEVLAGSLEGNIPEGVGGVSPNSSYLDEPDVAKLAQAYAGESARILNAAQRPGAMEASTPGGMMTVPQFLIAMATDHIIHGWDLARATGQDDILDSDVVEAAYAMMTSPETASLVDMGRQAGFVGPAVAVPDDARLQDKLVAHMGRQP